MAQPRKPATVLAGSMATDDYNRRAANNPFKNAKSLAAMKKIYSSMTAKQRGANVDSFRRAAAKLQTTKAKPAETTPVSKAKPADKKPGGKASSSPQSTTVTTPPASNRAVKGGYTISPENRANSKPKSDKPSTKRIGGSRSRRNARNAKMSIKDIGKNINKTFKLTYEEGQKVRKGKNIYVVKNGRMVFHSRAGQSKFPGKK